MKTESNVHLVAGGTDRATVSNAHLPDAIRRAPPAKRGDPHDRKAAADFMRAQRARFHTLHGGWSRSEWNHQVSQAALNNLERMTDARKHVQAIRDQNKPTSLRPVSDNQGADHATTKRDDIEINQDRRPKQATSLTQQATNSTCVTARRDGHDEAQPSWKAERERLEAKALEFERASKPHLWGQS